MGSVVATPHEYNICIERGIILCDITTSEEVVLIHPFWNTTFITAPLVGWVFKCPKCNTKLRTETVSEEIVCCVCNQRIGWEEIPEIEDELKFYD